MIYSRERHNDHDKVWLDEFEPFLATVPTATITDLDRRMPKFKADKLVDTTHPHYVERNVEQYFLEWKTGTKTSNNYVIDPQHIESWDRIERETGLHILLVFDNGQAGWWQTIRDNHCDEGFGRMSGKYFIRCGSLFTWQEVVV